MFIHYLKTAWRNIRANWVYSLLSVCCLAIGTAMFSVLFYGINYDDFFKNRIPGHKRSWFVYMESPENLNSDNHLQYRSSLPYSEYYDSLAGMPEVEMVSVSGGITEGLRFAAQDKVYCRGKLNGKYVEGDFFRYWNLTLLYGDRKPENKKEIVVSESLLKRMGYDKDISQCIVTSEERRWDTLYIVNVVQDDRWSRSLGADVFFNAQRMPARLPLYDVDVVLKGWASKEDINSRISAFELSDHARSGVMQLGRLDVNPDRRIKSMLLSLLSIIVLVVAVTNFLKHMIMVLKQRSRANIIRYSLGAKQVSLTLMLMAEVIVILICSLAIACYISSYVCTWLNQTVYMGDRYFHVADLLKFNTLTVVGVGAVCTLVCRFAVYGQNKVLRNRIVACGHERKVLKYIIICLESAVAVFALSSVLGISLTAPRPYNPLPKSVSDRTFYVETDEGSSNTDKQMAFVKAVNQLPQVEETVQSDGDWNWIDGVDVLVGRGDRYIEKQFCIKGYDINYFKFFNIPIEWLDPSQPSSGYLLDRKTYESFVKENVDISGVGIGYGHEVRPIRITGVFDQLMCGNPVAIEGDVCMGFKYDINTNSDSRASNFFVRFREGIAPSDAEMLIRKVWHETNPSAIEEPRFHSIPKYTDEDMRFTAMGFQTGGIVCILLVILSVTSSISAETNMRRKEVALRKINGAKAGNVMGLFIKPYCIILAVAFPIGILASLALTGKGLEIDGYSRPYFWIAPLSLVAMALIMALSVFSRIRAIMRTNPADVIKSE